MKGNKKLKGIGGWLLLPTIGLFLNILISIFWFWIYSYDDLMQYIIGFSMMFSIITLYLEFNYKKSFKIFAIISLWITTFVSLLISITLDEGFGSGALGAIIWTVYFIKSKRVKNTFTE